MHFSSRVTKRSLRLLRPVWYIYLKTENYYLKTFVKICVN